MPTETTSEWHLIKDEPVPNAVFDVVAKYYDPIMNMFLFKRFTDCVQVDGVILWSSPFERLYESERSKPFRLTDHGFRPTHWMLIPRTPLDAESV